jgi:hypothetical protein
MNEQTEIKDMRDLDATLQKLYTSFPNVEGRNTVNRTAFLGWPLNRGSSTPSP